MSFSSQIVLRFMMGAHMIFPVEYRYRYMCKFGSDWGRTRNTSSVIILFYLFFAFDSLPDDPEKAGTNLHVKIFRLKLSLSVSTVAVCCSWAVELRSTFIKKCDRNYFIQGLTLFFSAFPLALVYSLQICWLCCCGLLIEICSVKVMTRCM